MFELGIAVLMVGLLGVAFGGSRLRYLFFVRIAAEGFILELGFFFTRSVGRLKKTISKLGPRKKQ